MKLWPTPKQWKGWSLPSKYSLIGVCLALAMAALYLLAGLFGEPDQLSMTQGDAVRVEGDQLSQEGTGNVQLTVGGNLNYTNKTVTADKRAARIHFEQVHPFVSRAVMGNDQTQQYWSIYLFQIQIFNEYYASSIRAKYLKLTDLRKLDDDGIFRPWENAVPAILKWPAGTPMELSPGESVYVPFARIFEPDLQKVEDTLLSGDIEVPQLRFPVARWDRRMTSHVSPGTHRFKLTVFFENEPPAEAEFELVWSGERRESIDSMAKDIKIRRLN